MTKQTAQTGTLKKVLRYLRRYLPLVGLTAALAAVTVASTLLIPVYTGDAIDLILGPGQVDFAGLRGLILRMAAVLAAGAAAQWLMNLCSNRITTRSSATCGGRPLTACRPCPCPIWTGSAPATW